MLRYAREDTHYLLYIYDMMKNELLAQGFKYNSMNPH
jgi:exosome complex exonuclease RRP6